MNILAKLFKSSLGKKYLMAGSGAAMFLFVIGHMVGNLQIFLGAEQLNAYGHFLQSTPEILWPARLGLLAMVGLHIWSAMKLSAENRAARPVPYAGTPAPLAASYASRTMLMSGLIIASFLGYHLLHFTVLTPAINLTGQDFAKLTDAHGHHDVYRMMVTGFQHPVVAGFYVLAMALLCLHLSHGVSALFQSLGLRSPTWNPVLDRFGCVAAWVIFLGFIAVPVAVLTGLVK